MTMRQRIRGPAVVYRKECNRLNILEDYIWRSLPEWGDFSTNPNLTQKVNLTGEFLPFHGNTVVFDLSSDTKLALKGLQEERQSLPSGEETEPKEPSAATAAEEAAAEPAEAVRETEGSVEAPEAEETPRELSLEDFQNAEFEYIYSDWDEAYRFPYFYVNTGWYYLTGSMA